MSLGIKPTTSRQRRQQFIETLLNSTDKVSKISPNSVLSGLASGISKIAGKSEKDIILALSQLFPDTAHSTQLNQVALNFGLPYRFGALGSSLYIKVVASPGTVYQKSTHTFQSTSGIQFVQDEDSVSVSDHGYAYIKVSSTTTGSDTNVDPLSITQVTPEPIGHEYVINETQGFGGRDIEADDEFRTRIKNGANLLAKGTLESLTQAFMLINSKVLKCFYYGITQDGKIKIAVATQNGSDLSGPELDELLDEGHKYFCLSEHPPFGTNFYGVELVNVEYQLLDVSFRLDYDISYDIDKIRRDILTSMTKYLDFRTFDPNTELVEWDNLLQIVKDTPGVKYVPDQHFFPRQDVFIDQYKMPRIRGFLLLDMDGSIIQDISGNLSPVYYPNNPDFRFQQTVLNP